MRIAIFNNKGGTGKSTTAVNLAAGMARSGVAVTLVDLCPQGDSSLHLGIMPGSGFNPFENSQKPVDIVDNLRLFPADPAVLSSAEVNPTPEPLNFDFTGRGEAIIMDCPPALGAITTKAIMAADSLIIPVTLSFFSVAALGAIDQYLQNLKDSRYIKEHPKKKALLTQVDMRRRIDRKYLSDISKRWEIFDTIIPFNTDLTIACGSSKDIFRHSPNSVGAKAYENLVKEVLNG